MKPALCQSPHSVPGIQQHVAGTLSNQLTTTDVAAALGIVDIVDSGRHVMRQHTLTVG